MKTTTRCGLILVMILSLVGIGWPAAGQTNQSQPLVTSTPELYYPANGLITQHSLQQPLEAQQETIVSVLAPIEPVQVGQIFSVTVAATQVDIPLSAFQFDLTYDPTIVAFLHASSSPFLGSMGRMVACPSPAEGEGVIRLACASTGEASGVTGSGDLTILTFTALAAGESDFTIDEVYFPTDARPPALVTDFITLDDVVTVVAVTADLEIAKSVQTDIVSAGQQITYTLTVTNHGPTSVNALITDTLSPTEAYVDVNIPPDCTGNGPILCSLFAFTGTQSITMTITTAATFSGTLTNQAMITVTTLGATDDNSDNNTAMAQVMVYTPTTCLNALSGVNISGPTSGYTNTAYTFRADITPADATKPVLYTWMPQPQGSLLLSDRSIVTYTWITTGTKFLTVTAENCGGIFSDTYSIGIQGQTHTPMQKVFLPLILKNFPPPPPCSIPPTLLSPSNGETLNTLIPMFQWDNGDDPDATAGILVVGFNLGVPSGHETLRYAPAQGIETYRFMQNFAPGSTYYWRTQLICDGTDSPYSETWSFTTGSGGTILPASTLISPPNGSTITTLKTTLQWSAVAGATGYLLHWRKVGASTVGYGWLADTQKEVQFEADTTYEWWVSAYNEYALGDDSVKWQFTAPGEDVHAQLSNWGRNFARKVDLSSTASMLDSVHSTDTSFSLRMQSHDDYWADLDGDHDVDGADLARIADYWNCASGDTCYAPLYDLNADQIINVWDLARVGNEYDITPPVINVLSPVQGQVVGTPEVLVTGTLTDTHTVLSVTVNSTVAALNGTTFTATVPLVSGNQALNIVAEDELGQKGLTSRVVGMDGDGPMIQINTPKHRQAVYILTPTVAISYTDFYTSVDVASLSAQILDESGMSLDVIGDLTVMNDGAAGIVSVPLADDASYTLTVSLSDSYGNTSSASSTFYVPPDPMSIILPDEPDRAGWVSGVVYDSTACDAYLLTCQGLPGAAVTLAYSGGLAITGTIVTGPDGFFAFPLAETGQYWLRVEKEGYTYGQRAAEVVRERSTATNDIYLTPLDPVVTLCDDSGCNHTNSDGTVQVEIPAGVIPSGDIVTTTATNFEHVEFLPSGELPPETWETYAFNLGGDSEVTFTQPITVRIQNELGFSPTTEIPLGYWNQATLQWEHAGTGVVDASGTWVVMTVTHFSNYDCNDPIAPPYIMSDIKDRSDDNDDDCEPGANRCFVGFKSGILEEDISLSAVNIAGEAIAPRLLYNSQRAYPEEVIDLEFSLNVGTYMQLGNYIGFELYVEGEKTDSFFFSSDLQNGELGRYRYLWDGRDVQGNLLPFGVYEYAVRFSIPYYGEYCYALDGIFGNPPDCENGSTGIFVNAVNEMWARGTVELDSQQDNLLGAGWLLDGQQQLYENERGHIMVTDGENVSQFYFPQKDLLSNDAAGDKISLQRHPLVEQHLSELRTPNTVPVFEPSYVNYQAPQDTSVCGTLDTDTTWTAGAMPYRVTCDIIVPAGITLTIESGVTVQFEHSDSDLIISGTLHAQGTSSNPILFQPVIGTVAGSWGQVAFLAGSSGKLDHAILEYGGSGHSLLYLLSNQVEVTNSVVRYSAARGIYIYAEASPLISGTQILSNTNNGIHNHAGNPIIQNNTIISNGIAYAGGGILNVSGDPIIRGNVIEGNSASARGGGIESLSGNPVIQNNTILNNTAYDGAYDGEGGGIYTYEGDPIIQGNIIQGNFVGSGGGGIYSYSGNPFIQNNVIQYNSNQYSYFSGGGGIYIYTGNPVIEDNVIQYNTMFGTSSGGGIYNRFGDVTIRNNTIISNSVQGNGGGIANYAGMLTVQSNTFLSNTANSDGGGLYNYEGGLIIQANVFENNVAPTGGGISNHSGDLDVRDNTFQNNSATLHDGGGIHHYIGNLSIQGNIFRGNTAMWNGGGIYVSPGTYDVYMNHYLIINNNIIHNCSAQNGAGIYFSFSNADIQYNTIYGNEALENGGAFYYKQAYSSNPIIGNNIIANNIASDGAGLYIYMAGGVGYIDMNYNDVWENISENDYILTGTKGISADPLFVDAQVGDLHLSSSSPCIDAGNPSTYPDTDFEGDPRPMGLFLPDIGADEYLTSHPTSRTAADHSRLEWNVETSTYTRIYPDGTQIYFNPDGTHAFTQEPDGRQITYTYATAPFRNGN